MPHIHFCGARVFFYCAGGSLWLYLKFWALDFDKRESFLISLKDETERRSNSRRIKSEASKWARQHFRCTSGLFNNFSHTDGYCICNSSSPEEKREPRTMRGERGRRESSCCVNVVVVGLFLYFSTYRTAPQSVPYPSKKIVILHMFCSLSSTGQSWLTFTTGHRHTGVNFIFCREIQKLGVSDSQSTVFDCTTLWLFSFL